MNPKIQKSSRFARLLRWLHCEPKPINTRKHSLIRWLAFHGQITN